MHVPLANGHADLDRNVVVQGTEAHSLSPNESRLLRYLVERANTTVDHGELLQEVFGYAESVRSRTVITTMQRLRKKVEEDPAAPVHLHNVFGKGYRFEPLGSVDRVIGRASEVDAVQAALRKHERVWLIAPGGFGKTTVARRVAMLTWGDAVFVDLAEAVDDSDLVQAMANALGLARLDGLDAIARALQHRAPPLVVLDAAENLADRLAEVIPDWDVPVLVTSRRPMPSQTCIELGPLQPQDAARLLQRDRPLEPDENLAALLANLGGVPLALQLAANRLEVLSPALLARQVGALLPLLQGGEGRNASMEAALAWSWDACTPALREALRYLAVCRAGIELLEALALLPGPDPLAKLTALGEWGLVQRTGDRLFLPDPVREFVEAQGPHPEARAAHRRVFLELAYREVGDPRDDAGVKLLRTEWPNLRAAMETGFVEQDADAAALVACLGPGMLARNTMLDALGWFDRAIALAERLGARELLGRLLVDRANLWMSKASSDAAQSDLDRAQACGTEPGRVDARRGKLLRMQGDLEGSLALLERAVPQLTGNMRLRAQSDLGLTQLRMGRLDDAIATLREVLARARIVGSRPLVALAQGNLAGALRQRRAHDQALLALEEALATARALGDLHNAAINNTNLGNLQLDLGNAARAEVHWREAMQLNREIGSRVGLAYAQVNLAQLLVIDGRKDEALELFKLAHACFQEVGARPAAAFALLGIGRWQALHGEPDAAERAFSGAFPDLPEFRRWEIDMERCMLRAERDDLDGAQAALDAIGPTEERLAERSVYLAAGYIEAARGRRASREERERHRQAAEVRLRETRASVDPRVQALRERLIRLLDAR